MQASSETDAQAKKKKNEVSKTCIICNTEGPKADLTQPKDLESWRTLVHAAEIHQFSVITSLGENGVPEDLWYHLECRKNFTHKKVLQRITKRAYQELKPDEEYSVPAKLPREVKESCSRVYEQVCLFCDKTKYVKGSHSREQLVKAVDLRSDNTLRRIAEEKMDSKMLTITSRDIVAAEAHYHRSCYRNYTRNECTPHINAEEIVEGVEDLYHALERKAYTMLFKDIRNDLFVHPLFEKMVNITNTLVQHMSTIGVQEINPQTKKHIRRKLEAEFSKTLEIFPDETGKLFVIPDSLTKEMLVKHNCQLESEIDLLKSQNHDSVIEQCAFYMRSDIKKSKNKKPWPPDPNQLTNEYIPLPDTVSRFLTVLLTGQPSEAASHTSRVRRLIDSLGQDLIYTVTVGRDKPAKHILLPWVVKSLTGNVELIKILNRLGHSISYSQLEEIETALCLKKLENEDENGVVTPSNIFPCVPTCLAFDNIDRNEETLSGAGTSHRVNGIVVQPQVCTAHLPVHESHTPTKIKQRSIQATTAPLPVYNSGTRIGPPQINLQEADYTSVIQSSTTKNQVWSLARQTANYTQKFSSWTGFNKETRSDVSVTPDSIGYLPTINAPATEMSTVYEILCQVLKILEKLNLRRITCVFDQALYAKAVEIVWKDGKFKPIVIRMGVFHTLCNLMSIIGKRFQDAGLKDLAVESSTIAEGSIMGVIEGKKYNRAVRFHKLLYEALMRSIWKRFFIWLKEKKEGLVHHLDVTLSEIDKLNSNISEKPWNDLLKHPSCIIVVELFEEYLEILRKGNGNLSAFWMSYIDMVEVLLGMIRASREGNWMLHLAMIRSMIPWTFAYDKLNYARYLSVYYAQMLQLENDHPEVYEHMRNGGFSVQLGSSNPFSRVPVDQTIEETANKDTQTPGGTKGFSLNSGAISRFYLTAEYRSTCIRQLRQMVEVKTPGTQHHDLEPSRIKKDEKDIYVHFQN